MMHAIRRQVSSMDDWSDPCIRLIAISVAAAMTNNRYHPWITSSIRG